MATSTANCPCDNSTLANYKSWAQFISNFFTTAGWTQTSDTGQVVWSSAALPTSIASNYEVWKAADSAASTTPIYVKIEYGATSSVVEIRVTVGTGSNGSGTITGPLIGPIVITNNGTYSNQGGTTIPCYASGNAGEIRVMLWQGNSLVETIFGIERSKDTSGAVTTSYFTFLCANAQGTNSFNQQSIVGSSTTAKETNWMTFCCSTGSGTENFTTTASQPIWPLVGSLGNPMLGFGCACGADVGEGATVTVSIYGTNHTYIATKQNSLGNIGRLNLAGATGAVLMRYE